MDSSELRPSRIVLLLLLVDGIQTVNYGREKVGWVTWDLRLRSPTGAKVAVVTLSLGPEDCPREPETGPV